MDGDAEQPDLQHHAGLQEGGLPVRHQPGQRRREPLYIPQYYAIVMGVNKTRVPGEKNAARLPMHATDSGATASCVSLDDDTLVRSCAGFSPAR